MSRKELLLSDYTKENILTWYKNYKTYCYTKDTAELKHGFIAGEYKEIKLKTKNKKLQNTLFNIVKDVILDQAV